MNMKMIRHTDCFGSGRCGLSYPKSLSEPYSVIDTSSVVKNGRVMRESTIKVVNPCDMMKDFDSSDFKLENITAAGALELLKPTKAHLNNFEIAEMVSTADSSFEEYMSDLQENVSVEQKTE